MLGRVHALTSTSGIVALAAGGVALVALVWAISLTVALRRIRLAQRAVLGEGRTDLVDHAATLARDFRSLHDYVEDALRRVDGRVRHAEDRLDGAIAFRSIVRYDAYGEMSGRQSTSIALLDATRSGIVITSIHHRDQARSYVKQVQRGVPELELAPEEAEAVRRALSGDTQPLAAEGVDEDAPVRARAARRRA